MNEQVFHGHDSNRKREDATSTPFIACHVSYLVVHLEKRGHRQEYISNLTEKYDRDKHVVR